MGSLNSWCYQVLMHSSWRASVVDKSSVSLREEQHAFAKALVDAGRFPAVSAVLQHGLELSALRVLLQQRSEGAFISADQLRAKLALQRR